MAILLIPKVLLGVSVFEVFSVEPWGHVTFDLPDEQGRLTLYRKDSRVTFGSLDSSIEWAMRIELPDGRSLESDLMVGDGGEPPMVFHWLPVRDGQGPFLALENRDGITWVNLAAACLEDSQKPTEAIADALRCKEEQLPRRTDWRYFGRIRYRLKQWEFVREDSWPPDDVAIPWHTWPPIPLPDPGWTFEVILRPYPRRTSAYLQRYWIVVRGPSGARVDAWFREDEFGMHRASVHWLPATKTQGPYVRVGNSDGTLIDLRHLRAFQIYRAATYAGGSSGRAEGMVRHDRLETGTIIYSTTEDRFVELFSDGRREARLLEVPETVREAKSMLLGTIVLFPKIEFESARAEVTK
ncbi:MAG: hypothetical protein QNJ94_20570 [Alphaproteobacteria bacterium]|nr:hypothetical protein [Alphaproteobacteria bacterium]